MLTCAAFQNALSKILDVCMIAYSNWTREQADRDLVMFWLVAGYLHTH